MNTLQHDTHLHLDLYDNIPEIIHEIEKCKINTIAVTNLPVLYDKLKKNVDSKFIRIALGFHPELIMQYNKYIPLMWAYLKEARYIGEVGLDLKGKHEAECSNQIRFFEELILRCNSIGGKILSVHSKGSENELLSIIGNKFNGKIILHWYSGSLKNLDKAVDNGYYFSINTAMLKSAAGKKRIQKIPNDKILIESDGPFVKIDAKPIRPRDLEKTISDLADLKYVHCLNMTNALAENFKTILQIKKSR
jgi:TatD DNase family protein